MVSGKIINFIKVNTGTQLNHPVIRFNVIQDSGRETSVDAEIPNEILRHELIEDNSKINCSDSSCSLMIAGVEQSFKRVLGY